MNIFASPLTWAVLFLGFGVPLVLIVGARYLAYRLVGRNDAGSVMPVESLNLPTIRFASWWQAIRTLLLVAVLGTGLLLIAMRFIFGLGAVTNLSDQFPWGLWISFDVMSGVALAAGGFVMAATAHIFKRERYEPLVRPAILTALLGYLLVIFGLIVDLGRPYNVWRPLVHWQHHSVLWEVGVCVATYTTVLFIEFLPVILERVNQIKPITRRLPTVPFYRLLRRVSIVFVIMGVVLSTMHQSSLGSLWVLMPEKVHAIWYSLYLPVFFWLSAIAVGLAMTIVESTLSSKAFHRGLELDLLADLARAASVVLFIYLGIRGIDLIARGAFPLIFKPGVEAIAFWLEIGLGVIVPAVLFSRRSLRQRPGVLFGGALMVVIFGVVLNRLNVGIVSLWHYTGYIYVPTWMEILVTITLVCFGVIAFGLAAKYLPVFPDESEHVASDAVR